VLIAGCGEHATDGPAGPPGSAGETQQLRVSSDGWKTDFARHSVPLGEFSSGGPPRDGIPPIDEPKTISVEAADDWLNDREPVLVTEVDGHVRAYPVQILVWHEIVNDQLGGRSIAVTYCPLCNSSLVFDRDVAGQGVLRFGTTGNLRHSDLVMWDDRTESWWQQLTGEAVVGQLTGIKLKILPSQTLSWSDFKARYASADVLSRDTGHERAYGSNPYEGYDAPDEQPFLFEGETDDRLPAKERVAAVFVGDDAAVVPFSRLRKEPVVSFEIGDTPVVVMFKPGVASALDDAKIAESEDAGTSVAFDRRLGGEVLDFEPRGDGVVDRQTGSTWDITGRATRGPLRGDRLRAVRHDQQFWFALAAFLPDARIVP
jgi:hypothetical protein